MKFDNLQKRSHSSYRKGNQLKSTSERASVLLPTQALGADSNNEFFGAESLLSLLELVRAILFFTFDCAYLCQYGGILLLHICFCTQPVLRGQKKDQV